MSIKSLPYHCPGQVYRESIKTIKHWRAYDGDKEIGMTGNKETFRLIDYAAIVTNKEESAKEIIKLDNQGGKVGQLHEDKE